MNENMKRPVNFGGMLLDIKAVGADEALSLLNELNAKLKEANELIQKLALQEVRISINQTDDSSQ